MAIVYGRQIKRRRVAVTGRLDPYLTRPATALEELAAGDYERRPPCCDDCGDGNAAAAALARVAESLGGLERIAGRPGRGGHALRKLGRAHQSGELEGLGGLGDIDMSSFVVSQSTIDAESDAFDGRLNAWLLDYAGAAAQLPPAFVQQVDDFVLRWRKIRAAFYFFQTNRLHDVVNAEAEYNKLRDQFLTYGQTTAIAPATVTADGKSVRADEIPTGISWFDQVATIAKWGGVVVGGVVLLKVSSDLGLFRRLGRVIGGAPT